MAQLTNFSFEFFYKIFTEDASQPLLYHGAKKSKMTKNSNQGGSCLNFVYFVLLAESTKFSSIRKPYTYTSVSDTTVAVRKFLAYESWQALEYEIFSRSKISAITVNKDSAPYKSMLGDHRSTEKRPRTCPIPEIF